MIYSEAMAFLNTAKKMGSVLGLDRVRLLMSYLGNPENKLKFIHVTGTNGKGSTSACLSQILTESGIKTGSFNSPFIHHFEEQIRIDGVEISKKDVAETTCRVKTAVEQMLNDGHSHPTEFEIIFGIALCFFAEKNCGIVILEVGMGGSGDATNIIPSPELAIFTPISMDHMAFLGDSVEAIARVKAGIIKEGCIAVTAIQPSKAMNILQKTCRENNVDLFVSSNTDALLSYSLDGQIFDYKNTDEQPRRIFYPINDLKTPLLGAYQIENISLAITSAQILSSKGWPITQASIQSGIRNTKWPGRFEIIGHDPLFIVDGAHNPDGIEALAKSINRYFTNKKLVIITGVLADKDYESMMSKMLPYGKVFYTVTVPNPRSLPSADLCRFFTEHGAEAYACDSLGEAVARAKKTAGQEDVILAFGSLYFIGKLL